MDMISIIYWGIIVVVGLWIFLGLGVLAVIFGYSRFRLWLVHQTAYKRKDRKNE